MPPKRPPPTPPNPAPHPRPAPEARETRYYVRELPVDIYVRDHATGRTHKGRRRAVEQARRQFRVQLRAALEHALWRRFSAQDREMLEELLFIVAREVLRPVPEAYVCEAELRSDIREVFKSIRARHKGKAVRE